MDVKKILQYEWMNEWMNDWMNGVLIGLVGAGKPGINEWNNFILLIFLERKFTLFYSRKMFLSLWFFLRFFPICSLSIYLFIIVGVLSSVLLIKFTSSTFLNAMTHLFLFDWVLLRNLILFGANRAFIHFFFHSGFLSFHLNIDTKSIACNLILIVSWKWHTKKYSKRRTTVNRMKCDEFDELEGKRRIRINDRKSEMTVCISDYMDVTDFIWIPSTMCYCRRNLFESKIEFAPNVNSDLLSKIVELPQN